jgi:hypothetical protein
MLTEIQPSQTNHEESSRRTHRRLRQLESRRRWRESRREAREPEDVEAAELLNWIAELEQPTVIGRAQVQECPAETLDQETPVDRCLYVFTDFFQPHASNGRRLIYIASRPTMPSPEIWDTEFPLHKKKKRSRAKPSSGLTAAYKEGAKSKAQRPPPALWIGYRWGEGI